MKALLSKRSLLFYLFFALTCAACRSGCVGEGGTSSALDASEASEASAPVASADGRDSAADGATPTGRDELRARPTWIPKITNDEDFAAYSRVVGGERFTKIVVDLKTNATYYVDADLYPLHKDFIFAELLKTPRTPDAVRELDKNYGKDKPSFLMLYLVHHEQADLWTLAFWDGDKATVAHLRLAYERVKATFHLAAKVKFRPASDEQEAVAKQAPEIPSITNDQVYKAAGYQPFHLGRAIGKLRIVGAGEKAESLTFAPEEIVILPEPLTDITKVAGIVSQTFSTPLSHVNLRAAAWDIPNVGLKGAAKTYAALGGKDVVFEATATSASIRLATKAEVDAERAAKKALATVAVPRADLTATELRPLDGLHATDATGYGSKTANLGQVVSAKLAGVSVPAGFGVPIAYYAAHVRSAGLEASIDTMLADPKFKGSLEERKTRLAKLRETIVKAPIDPTFVSKLGVALKALSATGAGGDAGAQAGDGGASEAPVFVRSSTNAEDLKGFSGAGLYDTVPNVRGEVAVAEAVKRVWASVWNLAAFEERELYGIDHKKVYGAVLVQIGVDATAAGVLVTAHPTNPDEKNVLTINAKSGLGIRVVDGKKVPEILLYNVFNKALRVVSRSDEDTMLVFDPAGGVREVPNPQKGKPVLTTARVQRLADAAQKIRTVFPSDTPLDIEWLFRGEDVLIVQARPYHGGPKRTEKTPGPTP